MKKQYRYNGAKNFQYIIYIYHNGKLVKTLNTWLDELDDEIGRLEEQGYTYGYTEKEVKEEKQRYENMLANII